MEVICIARKYTEVEQLISIIEERVKAGETYREIGAAIGLTREEVRGAMHWQRAKEWKMATGYIPCPKGSSAQEKMQITLETHLLRFVDMIDGMVISQSATGANVVYLRC